MLMPFIEASVRFRVIAFGVWVLGNLSMLQGIRISNAPPHPLQPPRRKHIFEFNHFLYRFVNTCKEEGSRYKPPRTSHCSKCGCTVRMVSSFMQDHHCPFIDNCVGARNHKAFLLFSLYCTLHFAIFVLCSLRTYFAILAQQKMPFTANSVSIWLILLLVAGLSLLGTICLTASSIFAIAKNLTRLDILKGVFRINDSEGTFPNPYDLGPVANIATMFPGEQWTFWWPSCLNPYADATAYPMVPIVDYRDYEKMSPQLKKHAEDPIEASLPKTMAELIEQEAPKYEDTVFFYMGEQYRLKDIDSEQSTSHEGSPVPRPQDANEALLGIYEDNKAELDEEERAKALREAYADS